MNSVWSCGCIITLLVCVLFVVQNATTLERGSSSVVGRGLADHDQQCCYCHAPAVKPEAANAVVSSWWWARKHLKHVEPHKCQVINLWNCCIFLVNLFESYDDAWTYKHQIFWDRRYANWKTGSNVIPQDFHLHPLQDVRVLQINKTL